MERNDIRFIATQVLPELQGLVDARRQATYQRMSAAGEHKERWYLVILAIDARIAELEHVIQHRLELNKFVVKKVIPQ